MMTQCTSFSGVSLRRLQRTSGLRRLFFVPGTECLAPRLGCLALPKLWWHVLDIKLWRIRGGR